MNTTLHVLRRPVIEPLIQYVNCRWEGPVPAIRSGPHRLESDNFDDCPWAIKGVAYWYMNHRLCSDTGCRCRRTLILGEGQCLIAYTDGKFSLHRIQETERYERDVFDWAKIEAQGQRGGIDLINKVKKSAGADPWTHDCHPDAPVGLWLAVRTALERGYFRVGEGSG